jgi:hypothetical protein
VVLPDQFPTADGAETGLVVQGKAGDLLEEDPGLQCPHTGCFCRSDVGLRQCAAEAVTVAGP